MDNILQSTVIYSVSYRRKKTLLNIASSVSIIIAGVALSNYFSDIIKGHFQTPFNDAFYTIMLLVGIFSLLNLFFGATIFHISNGVLTVTKTLGFKFKAVYNLDNVEDLEVEFLKIKSFPVPEITRTKEQLVTFFYKGKEVALGLDLVGFDAYGLQQVMLNGNC